MKQAADCAIDFIGRHADFLGPALTAGMADYFTQLKTDKSKCTWLGWFTHVFCALFFGWFVGKGALLFGLQPDASSVAVASGAFLGTRVSEIALCLIYRKIERA